MHKFFKIIGIVIVIFGSLEQGWAFDRDYKINTPDFQKENFLDLQSYQLRPQLQEKWHETLNGLRVVSGSLGLDFLYLTTEIRMEQAVSQHLVASYRLKNEEFYAVKPLRQQVGLEFRFLENYAIAGIGMLAYDKRVGELGVAFTWGKRPWQYLRVSQLEQGPYYNEKNFEDDRFVKEPVEHDIEGAYKFLGKWSFRFHLSLDHPLEHYFPNKQLTFEHRGEAADWVLEYKPAEKERWGLAYRGFDFEKSRITPFFVDDEERQRQTLQYLSMDFYWLRPIWHKHTLTLGTRYDRFRNLLRNLSNQDESFDYQFDTWQVYGTWLHPWGSWWNLDYGLYVGKSKEDEDFLTDVKTDSSGDSIEAKLRIGLELYNLDNEGHLFFTTTWNVDNFFADFWDGGHGAYQTRF